MIGYAVDNGFTIEIEGEDYSVQQVSTHDDPAAFNWYFADSRARWCDDEPEEMVWKVSSFRKTIYTGDFAEACEIALQWEREDRPEEMVQ